jgi:hypothetical protein
MMLVVSYIGLVVVGMSGRPIHDNAIQLQNHRCYHTTSGGNLAGATTNLFQLVGKSEDCYATSEKLNAY